MPASDLLVEKVWTFPKDRSCQIADLLATRPLHVFLTSCLRRFFEQISACVITGRGALFEGLEMEMLPFSTWPLSGARCGVCVWGLDYGGLGGVLPLI